MTDNNPVTEPSRDDQQPRSMTRKQFCELENMSLSTFHKLKRAGNGPAETHFPGMTFARITPEARREWHAKIEEQRKSEAAKLEAQRRSAFAENAGRNAAASPLHVSKRQKGKSKSKSAKA
ncbi:MULTISPECIES: hypothetical protein [Bradyrhizobium]|uniref:AlpA family phage regulatory protein n=2 Tax=Bradyrhizobium TaxID=374 RepID=A0ABY0PYX8_9BRAD|nr:MULTISPECIES: hypothetical protein [Bradyrhizobium]SDJ18198.1 hypothetical protein SAMN05444163_4768 [Bradyrhizobium ottawaense]SEC84395.1 hypothetical protein SAMN05444171_2395 [Bradyrhizobium lablabi]